MRKTTPPPLKKRSVLSFWQAYRKSWVAWTLAVFLIAGFSSVILFYSYYSARAGLIDINLIKEMPKASLLYDYQGKQFGRFFEENRVELPKDQPVPKLLAEAVIAKEDVRFYSHGAVDPYGIARAALSNFDGGHGSRQGGSTITQQLARNSIGQLQRTYDRKFLEIFLAYRIEAAYTKDQILRHYLDRIYFGQGLYGAETTANAFFNVPASKLTLAQCALLAGMISAPNAYSPWKDIKAARGARDRTLDRMVKAGFCTQAEADKAKKAPLALRPRPDFRGGFDTSEIRRQLELELDKETIEQGGLKIFTTIDPRLQEISENALSARINEIETAKGEKNKGGDPLTGLPDDNVLQGAVFAMDPATGSIRAIVGSRDFGTSQYNRANLSKRQVGSTLKPLIYATAFAERGYNPASTIDATKFDLTAPGPIPSSFGQQNLMRINDALVKSDDYSAERMGEIVGSDLFNDYARRCGITTPIPPYRSSYLGACDLSLAELTGMFAVFADNGIWVRQHILVQVRDADDKVIYTYQPEGHRVFSEVVARQVTGMMQNVIDFGTGTAVRQQFAFTAPAAGKTGTTNDYKDALFEGFTSKLVVGVWMGYDKPKTIMHGGYASAVVLPVWASIMKQAQPAYVMEDFPVPPGLELVNAGGGLFGQGQRYYLTPEQTALLDQDMVVPGSQQDDQPHRQGKNIVDKFLDLFR